MAPRRAVTASPAAAQEHARITDPRAQRQLRRAIGIFGAVVLPFDVLWLVVGLLIGDAARASTSPSR